jgi:hypothetical protein
MQRWMDSVSGQTFLNYAYSWGASIVILGALFKLTHIAGANFMLFLGMGTEVFVFFLSAFDRPFDRGEIDKTLPDEPLEEEEDVAGETENAAPEYGEDEEEGVHTAIRRAPVGGGVVGGGAIGGPVVIGGGVVGGGSGTPAEGGEIAAATGNAGGATVVVGGIMGGFSGNVGGGSAPAGEVPAEGVASAAGGVTPETVGLKPSQAVTAEQISNLMNAANAEMLEKAKSAISPEMQEATQAYVDELKQLTDVLIRVSEQSERLTRDSEEMEQLNRTLTGINTIYEMQLKSISTQVGTIDQINDQTRKMAQQIEELNGVYSRMIKALTVNMKNAASASAAVAE